MISVIIPVYNTAARLEACYRSIAAQTLPDWECILVDDGSTDTSGLLCDGFAAGDTRVKVIHQENRGVSAARNRGLELACGEYIAFVDSDDTVALTYLETLHAAMVSMDADLAVCGMGSVGISGSRQAAVPSKKSVFQLDAGHIDDLLELECLHLLSGPVVKLYKKGIITDNSIHFDEAKDYGEDLLFNLSYLAFVRTIATVPEPLYCYIRRDGSLSLRTRPDLFAIDYDQWHSLLSFHDKKGLVTEEVMRFLYKRLWGIVYDGVFLFPDLADASRSYLETILAIPEIDRMKACQDLFNCASWIKRWILGRRAGWFYWYFRILYKKK